MYVHICLFYMLADSHIICSLSTDVDDKIKLNGEGAKNSLLAPRLFTHKRRGKTSQCLYLKCTFIQNSRVAKFDPKVGSRRTTKI